MSLFIEEKDFVTITVSYVFDKEDGEICVIGDGDIRYIKEIEAEGFTLGKDDEYEELGWDIPFNVKRVNSEGLKSSDICNITIDVRRPRFEDITTLMRPLTEVNGSGSFNPSQVIDYNAKRLFVLFKRGVARDQDGKEHSVDKSNLSKLSPGIGIALALKMNEKI
jgi:hypothetical protein